MKILIAIDEERCADSAVQFVADHRWKDPEFLLVHLIAPTFIDTPAYTVLLEEQFEQEEAASKDLLDQAAKKLKEYTNAPVSTYSHIGFAASAIVDIAKDWKADMIVVGSHGKHGLKRFILGSVSGEIASHADCSVIILQLQSCEKATASSTEKKLKTAAAT